MRWPPWQARPHSCDWRSRVVVACAEMSREAAEGKQYVLIARVLRILDPEHKLANIHATVDPRADPLFGTLPVTPDQPIETPDDEP